MFKNWGTWFGTEGENGQVKQEGESIVDVKEDENDEVNKVTTAAESERTSAAGKGPTGFSGK